MDVGFVGLSIGCGVFAAVAYRRSKEQFREGLKVGWDQALTMLPRMIMAILVSGFLSVLIPTDLVAALLGQDSGLKGVMIASVVGGFVPGGPIISFPIVVVLLKAGAGVAQLIAFLTAWSVFAFHRILAFEIPLMGPRFTAVRLLSSVCLPPIAGILAGILGSSL